jgi:hypothetical protein
LKAPGSKPGFKLESAWFQPLNLKCDIPVSKFAFECNLYRYVQAYLWITVWYVVSIFELIYVKHLVSTSSMTTWGQTYYQNVLSVPFLALMFIGLDETRVLTETTWTQGCVIAIALSCVAGLGMSFLSFLLRNMISVGPCTS